MSIKRKPKSIHSLFAFASSIISFVVVIVLSFILYQEFEYTARQNATTTSSEIITQVNYHLSNYIDDIMTTGNFVTDLAKTNDWESVQSKFLAITDSRHDIVTIAVFDEQGSLLCSTDEGKEKPQEQIVKQSWFQNALTGDNPYYFSSPHVQHLIPIRYPWVISYSRKVETEDSEGKSVVRILLIDMNFSFVSNLSQQVTLGNTGYIYIIDTHDNIIYHPKQTLINCGLFKEDIQGVIDHVFGTYQSTHQGRQRLTIIQTVDNCRWKIVGVAYMDELMSGMNRISLIIILGTLFAILLSIPLTRLVASHITSPIKQLEHEMSHLENMSVADPPVVKGSIEVESLSHAYREMVTRIRQLMTDILTQQELKRKSELDALEAKINPHFLYNTLDSVVWMAEQGNTEGVIKMVNALAKLFRISISQGHEVITIAEEIEHVRNYLLIQQMRFNNFEFVLNCEEDLKDRPTIKLLIQPLVENALYHGIKDMVDPGLIRVNVKSLDEETIQIEVIDNGEGMSEEQAKSLLTVEGKEKMGNGIGVLNVHQRIQLSYGKKYGLKIISAFDEGTTVLITLPKGPKCSNAKVVHK